MLGSLSAGQILLGDRAYDSDARRPADAFARAAYARALHTLEPRHEDGAAGVVRELWGGDEVTMAVLHRAAVAPAATTVSGWASQLAETAVRAPGSLPRALQ